MARLLRGRGLRPRSLAGRPAFWLRPASGGVVQAARIALGVLPPVLPVRSRRRQGESVRCTPPDPLRDVRGGGGQPGVAPPLDAGIVASGRSRIHPQAVCSARAAARPGAASRTRLRAGARPGCSRCRRRGEDARLPCWRLVATTANIDLSILILNYNTLEHLRACLASIRD